MYITHFSGQIICAIQGSPTGLYFHLNLSAFQQISYFPPSALCLGSQVMLTLTGSPLLPTPGACEATHILPAAQDGDLALSHFHWKTTAPGYHRCQQGTREVMSAMVLLAAAAIAGIGETCFAFMICSTILQTKTKACMCTHLDAGSYHHPDDCSWTPRLREFLGAELKYKRVFFVCESLKARTA